MARQSEPPNESTTELGVAHDHGDGDKNHMHRLGDLPHLHGEDGKAVLLDEQGRPLFTDDGKELPDPAPRDPRTVEDGAEWPPALPAPDQSPAVFGPPGHSIGDVAANGVIDSVLFDDVDPALQSERVWARLATTTLLRAAAEFHRYGKLADAGLLMALRDQVEQLVANRGLGNGGGS